ncbi:hypothetical protein BDZ91DRAFT_792137 [Kalaharituber pfeilii]|nr:hypothetical protein BDZ91DRAFT_792137 [Kalaharituber pfeilii]
MPPKRKHEETVPGFSNTQSSSARDPLQALELHLLQMVKEFRNNIFPEKIESLSKAMSLVFQQPFWGTFETAAEPDADMGEGDHGSARKRLRIESGRIGTDPKQATDETISTGMRNSLHKKLCLLRDESKYLIACCTSLEVWASMAVSREDEYLVQLLGDILKQAGDIHLRVTKCYADRAIMVHKQAAAAESLKNNSDRVLVVENFKQAVEEYDSRLEDLAGSQAIKIIGSYATLLRELRQL